MIMRRALKWTLRMFSGLIPDRVRYILLEYFKKIKKLDYTSGDIFLVDSTAWESARADESCRQEPETVKWIEEDILPGDVLYDIGANIGVYSLLAAKNNRGIENIYAFEPSFLTFKTLCENISLNNFADSIIPLHIALSEKTSIGKFHYASLVSGDSMHAFGDKIDIHGKIHEPVLSLYCQSYRLDDLVKHLNLKSPTHIKIDVDGIELQILSGASQVLTNGRMKSLLIEVNESTSSAEDTRKLLDGLGFVLSARHRHGAVSEDGPLSGVYNYLFKKRNG